MIVRFLPLIFLSTFKTMIKMSRGKNLANIERLAFIIEKRSNKSNNYMMMKMRSEVKIRINFF